MPGFFLPLLTPAGPLLGEDLHTTLVLISSFTRVPNLVIGSGQYLRIVPFD